MSRSGAVAWDVASRRTFGIMPGRARWRTARTRSSRSLALVKARARLVVELVAAWIDAQIARLHVRRDAWVLGRERARCLAALGAAVHEGREDEADRVKSRLAELDAGIAGARVELGRIDEWIHERLAVARLEDGSTEQVPVPVPEPSPVPLRSRRPCRAIRPAR